MKQHFIRPSEKVLDGESVKRRAEIYMFDPTDFVNWLKNNVESSWLPSIPQLNIIDKNGRSDGYANVGDMWDELVFEYPSIFTYVGYDSSTKCYTIDVDFTASRILYIDRFCTNLTANSLSERVGGNAYYIRTIIPPPKTVTQYGYFLSRIFCDLSEESINQLPQTIGGDAGNMRIVIRLWPGDVIDDFKWTPAGSYEIECGGLTYLSNSSTEKANDREHIRVLPKIKSFHGIYHNEHIKFEKVCIESFDGISVPLETVSYTFKNTVFKTFDFLKTDDSEYEDCLLDKSLVDEYGVEYCEAILKEHKLTELIFFWK